MFKVFYTLFEHSSLISYPLPQQRFMTSYKPNDDSKKLRKLVKNDKPKAEMQVK